MQNNTRKYVSSCADWQDTAHLCGNQAIDNGWDTGNEISDKDGRTRDTCQLAREDKDGSTNDVTDQQEYSTTKTDFSLQPITTQEGLLLKLL